jgi:hypothetical protein
VRFLVAFSLLSFTVGTSASPPRKRTSLAKVEAPIQSFLVPRDEKLGKVPCQESRILLSPEADHHVQTTTVIRRSIQRDINSDFSLE